MNTGTPTRRLPPDSVIIALYSKMMIPSDRLAGHWDDLTRFISRLPKKHQWVDPGQLVKRIIQLRKNGALPRIRDLKATV